MERAKKSCFKQKSKSLSTAAGTTAISITKSQKLNTEHVYMWAAAHLSAPVGTAGPDPAFLGVVANYRRRSKQGGTQFKRNLFFCWFVSPFYLKNVLNLFEILHLKKKPTC